MMSSGDGGKPAATIVTPATSDGRVAAAASELQHCVERICGVRLPIRKDGKRVKETGQWTHRGNAVE